MKNKLIGHRPSETILPDGRNMIGVIDSSTHVLSLYHVKMENGVVEDANFSDHSAEIKEINLGHYGRKGRLLFIFSHVLD